MACRIDTPVSWDSTWKMYPWHEYLDGTAWEVTADDTARGGSLESFRSGLYKAARVRGLTVKSKFVGCDPFTGEPLAVHFQVQL